MSFNKYILRYNDLKFLISLFFLILNKGTMCRMGYYFLTVKTTEQM